MREFFRGWKTKTGVLTLVLASVLMAGWVRSRSRADTVMYPVAKRTFDSLVSATGSLVWQRTHLAPQPDGLVDVSPIGPTHLIWSTSPLFEGVAEEDSGFHWRWRFCGLGIADTPPEQTDELGMSATFLYVPYWSIVVPLTLLSAFLLLSRFRKSPSTKIPVTAAIEGA